MFLSKRPKYSSQSKSLNLSNTPKQLSSSSVSNALSKSLSSSDLRISYKNSERRLSDPTNEQDSYKSTKPLVGFLNSVSSAPNKNIKPKSSFLVDLVDDDTENSSSDQGKPTLIPTNNPSKFISKPSTTQFVKNYSGFNSYKSMKFGSSNKKPLSKQLMLSSSSSSSQPLTLSSKFSNKKQIKEKLKKQKPASNNNDDNNFENWFKEKCMTIDPHDTKMSSSSSAISPSGTSSSPQVGVDISSRGRKIVRKEDRDFIMD